MKQLPWILVGLLSAALLFSLFFRGCASPQSGQGDTVWLPVRVDTIRDTAVAPPVSERPAGTDTACLPVYRPQKPSGSASIPDSIADTATVVSDSLSTGTDSVDVIISSHREGIPHRRLPDSHFRVSPATGIGRVLPTHTDGGGKCTRTEKKEVGDRTERRIRDRAFREDRTVSGRYA